jgi:hypothetical protein
MSDMTSTALAKYDAACRAVAEARTIDEVKNFRDRAVAMAAYARQAKNRDLEADAVEIRMRATRRLHELVEAQRETVGLNAGARGVGTAVRVDEKPTLAEQGIDKNLAHQARTLGRLSGESFEEAVADAREAVTSTAPKDPTPKPAEPSTPARGDGMKITLPIGINAARGHYVAEFAALLESGRVKEWGKLQEAINNSIDEGE